MPAITVAMRTEISQLYVSLFGRAPDGEGLGFWTKSYSDGNTLAKIAQSMYDTTPARAYYPLFATPSEVVTTFYTNVLGRAPDAEGLAFWVKEYNASATQGAFFDKLISNVVNYNGTDAAGLTSKSLFTNKVAVAQYYGEQNGTVAGATAALNGVTSAAASVDTAKAAILTASLTVGVSTFPLTTSTTEIITATGTNNVITGTQLTLNANDVIVGSSSGTTRLNLIDNGTAAFNPTAASITNVQTVALKNINGTPAVSAVTAVPEQQTVAVTGTIGGATSTVSFLGVATASVASGSVASTVAAAIVSAKAAIIEGTQGVALGLIDIANTGATLTLTFSSAKGNVANVFSPQSGTGGVISFGAGVETVQGVAGVPAVSAATFTDTVAAGGFGGATLFINDASTSQVDFTGLASTQAVQINGNGTTNLGNTNATWTSATAATLNLNGGLAFTGGTGVVALIGNMTTVTINSTGTATGTSATAALGANVVNGIALGSAATTVNINASNNLVTNGLTQLAGTTATINVTGTAGLVNLGTIANTTVKTVNAATFAGGITATLNSNATLAFTGGLGNDTVTTSSTLITTGSVNAGGGTGDILVLTRDISSTGDASKYTNFDILRVQGAATQDVSLFSGITAVQLQSGGNAITGLSATQAAAMNARADITTLTAALSDASGTADVFTMSLGTGAADATEATDTGVLTLTGFETINLSTRAGTAATPGTLRVSTIAGFDAINANTINLSGTAFDITDIANQTGTRAKVLTVNGSALIGDGASTNVGLTLAGVIFAGSSVIGSTTANNVFTIGSAADTTYTGGNANDSFTGAKSEIAATTLVGGSGTDTLVIADGADTIANTTFAKVTGMELLTLSELSGLSLTTGSAFNTAFSAGTVTITATALDASAVTTINTAAYTGSATLVVTTLADAEATTLTTGAGADTVTLTAHATTTGLSTISTGAGADTITANHTAGGTLATNATLTINGGADADIIISNWAGPATAISNVIFTIAAGESTLVAYDKITGFYKGAGGNPLADTLDFAGSAIKPANGFAAATVTGYTAAQLQVAASTAGLLTFTGTLSGSLTNQMVIDAYVSTVDSRIANLETVVWSGSNSTLVFNNNLSGDSLVELVGVTGVTAVGAAATTANLVGIA